MKCISFLTSSFYSSVLLSALFLTGCPADPDDNDENLDSGTLDDNNNNGNNNDDCASAPVTTYANFGRAFLTSSCQSCHASNAPERFGAPVGVVFDTEQDAILQKEAILSTVFALEQNNNASVMPPGGGIRDEDKTRLQIWLRCFAQ